MFFKHKPSCFGNHTPKWKICEECNFATQCKGEQIRFNHEGPKKKKVWGVSVSEAMGDKPAKVWDNKAADKHFRDRWGLDIEDGRSASHVQIHTPAPKPPPKPRTRLCKGIVEDPNMAIMFGIGKYAEVIGYLKPSELVEEFKRIYRNDDGDIRDRRLEIIKDAVESGPPQMWERFSRIFAPA